MMAIPTETVIDESIDFNRNWHNRIIREKKIAFIDSLKRACNIINIKPVYGKAIPNKNGSLYPYKLQLDHTKNSFDFWPVQYQEKLIPVVVVLGNNEDHEEIKAKMMQSETMMGQLIKGYLLAGENGRAQIFKSNEEEQSESSVLSDRFAVFITTEGHKFYEILANLTEQGQKDTNKQYPVASVIAFQDYYGLLTDNCRMFSVDGKSADDSEAIELRNKLLRMTSGWEKPDPPSISTDFSDVNIDLLISYILELGKGQSLAIQGPPGSGKSHLIAKCAEELLKMKREDQKQKKKDQDKNEAKGKTFDENNKNTQNKSHIDFHYKFAVCAYTHKATDNIYRAITEKIGNSYVQLLGEGRKKSQDDEKEVLVYVGTIFAIKSIKESCDFLFIDEAGMINAAIASVSIQKNFPRIIYLGDPMQLPPVVLSSDHQEEKAKLLETPFSYLPRIMLDRQFRGRADFFLLDSILFYSGLLKTARVAEDFPLISPLKAFQILNVTSENTDRRNYEEAKVIKKMITELYNKNPLPLSIAIVTPFRAQVSVLKETLRGYIKKFCPKLTVQIGTVHTIQGQTSDIVFYSAAATSFSAWLAPPPAYYQFLLKNWKKIENNALQQLDLLADFGYDFDPLAVLSWFKKTRNIVERGANMDIDTGDDYISKILEALVLGNENENIDSSGHYNPFAPNLLNVAITRAKRHLVIVGNWDFLREIPIYDLLFHWEKLISPYTN